MRLHLSDFKSLDMKLRLYATYSGTPTIIAVWWAVAFWHQVTLIFSSLKKRLCGHTCQTDAQFEEAVRRGSIHKLQNSVLQAYVS